MPARLDRAAVIGCSGGVVVVPSIPWGYFRAPLFNSQPSRGASGCDLPFRSPSTGRPRTPGWQASWSWRASGRLHAVAASDWSRLRGRSGGGVPVSRVTAFHLI